MRQGDVQSTLQYCTGEGNKDTETSPNGTIFNRARQYTSYAENVLIFERSVRASEEVVTHNKESAVSTGLLINENKTKHSKMKRNIKIFCKI
jgi:hypothetical protein